MAVQLAVKVKRFLTVKEVAEELSIGLATAYRIIEAGRLKATRFKTTGHTNDTIRVERKHLESYIAECQEG